MNRLRLARPLEFVIMAAAMSIQDTLDRFTARRSRMRYVSGL